jgi:ATP-dependent RNA helicase DDX23/PRP28
MAKRYLRHPAVVSVGDQDSGKNARIVQRVIFLSSPSQKESALRDLVMNPRFLKEKIIVFVNEKKHADGIGRMVERFGRRCVVLHGGKSQEQREENLAAFRQGGVVLVSRDSLLHRNWLLIRLQKLTKMCFLLKGCDRCGRSWFGHS